MSVTATLNGNLQLTDNLSGSTTFLKQLLLSYAGTVASYAQNFNVGTSPVSLAISNQTAQFVYIRNLASASSGGSITVTWTPTGGSSNAVLTLSPGSAVLFCETNNSNGISAVSLIASAVNTEVEYILVS